MSSILNASAIIQVIKTEATDQIIEQQSREDATATLIYSIAKHFIGEPKLFQAKSLEILNNLTCPKLHKQYENFKVPDLLKPCYTNHQYIDTSDPIKIRRYFEFILVDTDSIEIEHSYFKNNPEAIEFSKFTIKRILSPFNWFVDHLQTPIPLSQPHKPQTFREEAATFTSLESGES